MKPKIDWDHVNWDHIDADLARKHGCSRENVRQRRAKHGRPPLHRGWSDGSVRVKLIATGERELLLSLPRVLLDMACRRHKLDPLAVRRVAASEGRLVADNAVEKSGLVDRLKDYRLPNASLDRIWRGRWYMTANRSRYRTCAPRSRWDLPGRAGSKGSEGDPERLQLEEAERRKFARFKDAWKREDYGDLYRMLQQYDLQTGNK